MDHAPFLSVLLVIIYPLEERWLGTVGSEIYAHYCINIGVKLY